MSETIALEIYYVQTIGALEKALFGLELNPIDLGFQTNMWRFEKSIFPLKFFHADRAIETSERPEFALEVPALKDFWVQFGDLPAMALVTRIRVVCLKSIFDNPDELYAWTNHFQSRSIVMPLKGELPDSTATAALREMSPSRMTDWISLCAIDTSQSPAPEDLGWEKLGTCAWRSLFRNGENSTTDFWRVQSAGPRGPDTDETKFDSTTIFFFFLLMQIQLRIFRDVPRRCLPLVKSSGGLRHGDAMAQLLEQQRIVLIAKLALDQSRLVKNHDEEKEVFESMSKRNEITKIYQDRTTDLQSLVKLGADTAALSTAQSTRLTAISAAFMGLFGLLGAFAGIVQAIDRSESPAPFLSAGSNTRLLLIIGLSACSILGSLVIYFLLLKRRIPR